MENKRPKYPQICHHCTDEHILGLWFANDQQSSRSKIADDNILPLITPNIFVHSFKTFRGKNWRRETLMGKIRWGNLLQNALPVSIEKLRKKVINGYTLTDYNTEDDVEEDFTVSLKIKKIEFYRF